MKNLPFHSSVCILTVALAVCPMPAASQGLGAVEIALQDAAGQPAAGLIVALEGTCQQVVSDTNGVARFENVPAGGQTWSVAKELEVPDDAGHPVVQRFTVESAVKVDVLAGQEVTVVVTVEIKVVIVVPAVCKSTPWCGIVGGKGPAGTLRVVTGGGVHGTCPCLFGGGPVVPPACPGRVTVDPAAPGPWTITTTTCLGGAGCVLPNKAVTCSISV